MKYVKGHVACVENNDGSLFAALTQYLYSSPFATEKEASDWVWAQNSITEDGVKLIRMECNDVPEDRIVH